MYPEETLCPAIAGARGGVMTDDSWEMRRGWSWWYLLFIIEFVLILWPPFYNRVEPSLIGIPFFYLPFHKQKLRTKEVSAG